MKKIFLLAGIAAFSFASAQQNDVFDIQKHLEKKSMDEKKGITNPLSKILKPGCGNHPVDLYVLPNRYLLPNGNTVCSLQQDNMPCIEPDMSQFNMPNSSQNKITVVPVDILKSFLTPTK